MIRQALCALTLATLPPHCEPPAWLGSATSPDRGNAPASQLANTPQRRSNSLRLEALDDTAVPPTFVMRGEPHGPGKMVFIHGMCGHALGYAQSFQWSAAKQGVLVAPQGDVPCSPGSPWAKWSLDTAALDARILAAFRALGSAEPIADIALIGYSQGASRAEALARRWPDRYTRLILIAGPHEGLTLRPRGSVGVDDGRLARSPGSDAGEARARSRLRVDGRVTCRYQTLVMEPWAIRRSRP